jgi:hypothetical protein
MLHIIKIQKPISFTLAIAMVQLFIAGCGQSSMTESEVSHSNVATEVMTRSEQADLDLIIAPIPLIPGGITTVSFPAVSNQPGRSCSAEVKNTRFVDIPTTVALPVTLTVDWSADDDISINGQRLGGGCSASSGKKLITFNNRRIQVDLVDTVGINWGGSVSFSPANVTPRPVPPTPTPVVPSCTIVTSGLTSQLIPQGGATFGLYVRAVNGVVTQAPPSTVIVQANNTISTRVITFQANVTNTSSNRSSMCKIDLQQSGKPPQPPQPPKPPEFVLKPTTMQCAAFRFNMRTHLGNFCKKEFFEDQLTYVSQNTFDFCQLAMCDSTLSDDQRNLLRDLAEIARGGGKLNITQMTARRTMTRKLAETFNCVKPSKPKQ